MEEKSSLSKGLLVLFRVYLKLVPMCLAFIYFINTIISYYGLNVKILNYLVFAILILFVYIASYLLKFCEYHRMFLHYTVAIHLINLYDCYIGIPINDYDLMIGYSILTIIFMFITLYLKLKNI